MTKSIILCADDYGFSPSTSKAIISLLAANRISAISCMVNSPYWQEHAAWLNAYENKADIGLHFTLTDITPATTSLYKHPSIIKKAYLRQLKQSDIEKELTAQVEKFERALGHLPHFIDGHQHIHQLPVIRQALLSVYETTFPKKNCYIRVPIAKAKSIKPLLIKHTGATALKRALKKRSIPYNKTFSGIYHFSPKGNYQKRFRQFLKDIESTGIIMCHPGLSHENATDEIAQSRQQEYNYLNSDEFIKDCQTAAIQLTKMVS